MSRRSLPLNDTIVGDLLEITYTVSLKLKNPSPPPSSALQLHLQVTTTFLLLQIMYLDFKADIGLLTDEVKKMEKTSAVIGIGLDLSPHYRYYKYHYMIMHNLFNQIYSNSIIIYIIFKLIQNGSCNKSKIETWTSRMNDENKINEWLTPWRY